MICQQVPDHLSTSRRERLAEFISARNQNLRGKYAGSLEGLLLLLSVSAGNQQHVWSQSFQPGGECEGAVAVVLDLFWVEPDSCAFIWFGAHCATSPLSARQRQITNWRAGLTLDFACKRMPIVMRGVVSLVQLVLGTR